MLLWTLVVIINKYFKMKKPDFTNIAIFILFFGIALIEAIKKQNWLEAALFLALGIISFWADFRKR